MTSQDANVEQSILLLFLGIFKDGPFDKYLDITGIGPLTSVSFDPLVIGSALPIGDFIDVLESVSNATEYAYAKQLANHLKKVLFHSAIKKLPTVLNRAFNLRNDSINSESLEK